MRQARWNTMRPWRWISKVKAVSRSEALNRCKISWSVSSHALPAAQALKRKRRTFSKGAFGMIFGLHRLLIMPKAGHLHAKFFGHASGRKNTTPVESVTTLLAGVQGGSIFKPGIDQVMLNLATLAYRH